MVLFITRMTTDSPKNNESQSTFLVCLCLCQDETDIGTRDPSIAKARLLWLDANKNPFSFIKNVKFLSMWR